MSYVYSKFDSIFGVRPSARAIIKGSEDYPKIDGDVWFYKTRYGIVVVADITGLPKESECSSPIFAFHIHAGDSCMGDMEDHFADAGMHYNPNGCPHPYHAGDLPPLFSANGNAFLAVLTDRFNLNEIINRVVIIHSKPDDFTTQPSGNSGIKIACGKIEVVN